MSSTNAVLTGLLTDVFPIESTERLTKRVFWLKEPDTERYPQHWQMELHGDDVKRLAGIGVGDTLECHVEIRGRKYKNKMREDAIFITLKCIGLKVIKKCETVSGKLGTFKPIEKVGREKDADRPPPPQGELPL